MKRGIAGVWVFGLLAGIAFAGGFWEKEKYTDWNAEDIQKLMADSPWAKTFEVSLKGFGGPPGGLTTGMNMGGSGGEGGGEGGGGGAGRGGRGGVMSPSPAGPSGTSVSMRWRSALPLRQAIARHAALRQAPDAAEAQEAVSGVMQVYSVEIAGLPVKAVPADPQQIRDHAELRVKNQAPVRPADVRMEMQGRTMTVFLLFPKRQAGAHEIIASDQEVEVFLQLESGKVAKKFKLKDMMFDGKLEL
jgi:hypothetical protein